MIQTTGIKIQTTSMFPNPKSSIDIEKNKRNANKNNPIIRRIVPRLINLVFIFNASS